MTIKELTEELEWVFCEVINQQDKEWMVGELIDEYKSDSVESIVDDNH